MYPGADIYLEGTVPTGAVASANGAHLRKRAARVMPCRRLSRLHLRLSSRVGGEPIETGEEGARGAPSAPFHPLGVILLLDVGTGIEVP
jgi:hypothetical protein